MWLGVVCGLEYHDDGEGGVASGFAEKRSLVVPPPPSVLPLLPPFERNIQ